MADTSNMQKLAVSTVSLAAVVLVGIAVVQGFKDSGKVSNTTADAFIAGLAIFGTFIGIIVLGVVGKVLIGLFRGSK